jgi:diadenylate cyclase
MFSDLINLIISCVKTIRPNDIFDIVLVAIIFFQAIKFIKNTRAASLVKGIILFFILMLLADIFRMNATSFLLKSTLQFGVLALLIMFQPELRKVLEQVGRGKVARIFTSETNKSSEEIIQKSLSEVSNAMFYLAANHIGALIAFERETKLGDIINTGVRFNASASAALLENLFFPNAPLHDGAVIIRNGEICAAGCFLPLTENNELATELGTRHRAALGLSEISDAIILVVSEETSTISVASAGTLKRGFTKDSLLNELNQYFGAPEPKEKKKKKWRIKKK